MAHYFMIVSYQDTKGWHGFTSKARVSSQLLRRHFETPQPAIIPIPAESPALYSDSITRGVSLCRVLRALTHGVQNLPLHIGPGGGSGYAVEGPGLYHFLERALAAVS